MDLKYGRELRRYNSCPPPKAVARAQTAFRFVFDRIDDERNFLPAARRDPQRTFKRDALCISMSLSLFDTRDQAANHYAALKQRHRNVHKTIGTHLAKGNIKATDGVATPSQPSGHFSFFESKGTDLATTFEIAEPLCNDPS